MRFIEGLRDDLRAPVLIQCPSTLDTAFVLAQLQDEVSFLIGYDNYGTKSDIFIIQKPN